MQEHYEWLAAVAGVVRDEHGNVDWRLIFQGVVTAAIVGLSAATIDQGRDLATLAARQQINLERVSALENGNTAATGDRYRASDARRDFERAEKAHQLDMERLERQIRELEARIRDVERRR